MISQEFKPAFSDTLEYFKRNFILPVDEPETNLRIDFAAGLTVFDKEVISRRTRKSFGGAEVFVCTLEDLIIYKLFAGRYADLSDIEFLLEKNISTVDKKYLLQTAESFVELEREDMLENLNKLLKK